MINDMKELLKKAISEETHLDQENLMDKEPFESYGIESVMMVSITRKLEKKLGELPKTLFFEYSNIEDLATYLNANYNNSYLEHIDEDIVEIEDGINDEDIVEIEDGINDEDIVEIEDEINNEEEDDATIQIFDLEAEDLSDITDVLDEEVEAVDENKTDDIAIIGISGRFPEADDINEFWKNICEARDCITEIPPYLWDWKKYWSPEKGVRGKSYTKWGGFLRDADKFDPLFFNISNLEAESLDPQERIFLETVYHTIENAGYTRQSLNNYKVGVYVGVMWGQYQLYGSEYANAQSSYASIANRVSYFFDFNGPSIALDTMCSSSITSVHLACESLKNNEIDFAIAGGVNVDTHYNKHLYLSKTGFASTDGRCRSFGEGGDGYVPGDGSGALLLKPLWKAKRDGDNIYAVIKSTNINHGGKAQGYTVPNPKAQTELIETALKKANVKADTLSYMEMHGTGTSLGDPIEVRALTNVFKKYTDRKEFIPIGSVKSNIGHLESAAGFAGIAKVVLQMQHKKLVPSIHSEVLNPNINFSETPFYVQRELSEWKETEFPRRAGVSSFGAGGANGFVLLEEYEDKKEYDSIKGEKAIILSAREKKQLYKKIDDLHEYLTIRKQNFGDDNLLDESLIRDRLLQCSGIDEKYIDDDDELVDIGITYEDVVNIFEKADITEDEFYNNTLEDLIKIISNKYSEEILEKKEKRWSQLLTNISYTLQVGREDMEYRIALIVNSYDDLLEKLRLLKDKITLEKDCWYAHVLKKDTLTLNDEKSIEFIDKLLKENRIKKLAKLWCRGYKVSWSKLYEGKSIKKVALPEYPFAKERCWVSDIEETNKQSKLSNKMYIGKIDAGKSINNKIVYVNEIHNFEEENKNDFLIDYLINAYTIVDGNKYIKSINIMNDDINIKDKTKIYTSFEFNKHEILINIYLSQEKILAQTVVVNEGYKEGFDFNKVNLYKHYKNSLLKDEIEKRLQEHISNNYFEELKISNEWNEAIAKLNIDVIPRIDLFKAIKYSIQILRDCDKDEFEEIEIKDLVINDNVKNASYLYIKKITEDKYNVLLVNKEGEIKLYIKQYSLVSLKNTMEHFFYEPKFIKSEKVNDNITKSKNSVILYTKEDKSLLEQIKKFIKYDVSVVELKKGFEVEQSFKDKISNADTIYFLGGINKEKGLPNTIKGLDNIIDKSLVNLWRMVKALEKINDKKKVSIKVITNNIYKIEDGDEIQPSTASVIGLSKVLDKEYKNYNFTIADISLEDKKLEDSLKVIINDSVSEQEFAVRSGEVYKRILEPVQINSNVESKFKENGVYILLGGAGNVGVKMSSYLSEKYNAHLVWIGRREIDESISRNIEMVNSLGGNVEYYSGDIADEHRMNEIFNLIEKEKGQINAIFNLAMNFEIKRISAIDNEQYLKNALKAKVYGEYVLNNVLKNRNVDFVIYFSSGEVFTGNVGWGLYAAACAFSDSLSTLKQNDKSYSTYTINWGFWQTADEEDNEYFARKGILPITKEQGSEAMERILASGKEQVMALNVSKNILKLMGVVFYKEETAFDEIEETTYIEEEGKGEAFTKLEEVNIVYEEDLEEKLADKIKEIFAEVLKIKKQKIDIDNDLANYGIDSLIVTSISLALEEKMGKIPATLIIEQPTIRDIAKELILNHKENVNRLFNIQYGKNNKVKNVEVLHTIKRDDIESFLKQYGNLYRDNKLRNKESSIVYDEYDLNKESEDKLIHFLMKSKDGQNVEVFEYGHGQPLLLLPAIGLTAPIWIKQFLTMSDKYKIIVIHVPGYGLSDLVSDLGTKRSGEIIIDIIKKLNFNERVNITASCLGTVVASYLARFYPDIFKTVCFVGGFYDNSDLPNIDASNLSVEELNAMMMEVSSSIGKDFDAIKYLEGKSNHEEEKKILLDSRCANSLAAIRYMNEMLTLNTSEWLKEIKIPALCIFGDKDTVIKPERSKAIHEYVKNSVLKEIKNSAHYPFLTNTEEFNELLDSFINN